MRTLAALLVCFGMFVGAGHSQNPDDFYSTGATIVRPNKACPLFVWGMFAGSPAAKAGIKPGDRLVAIGGQEATDRTVRLIRSDRPGPVVLRLQTNGKLHDVNVERELYSTIIQRAGKKSVHGIVVPLDTSEAEVQRMAEFDGRRYSARLFPLHYPSNPDLFYGGFEVFDLHDPAQIVVGGIEDGPASKAGVHWGDVILSVNGIDPNGRTPADLETLFSSDRPVAMRLKLDRLGTLKAVEFTLQRASDVLQRNHLRMLNGKLVPAGLSDQDATCLLAGK